MLEGLAVPVLGKRGEELCIDEGEMGGILKSLAASAAAWLGIIGGAIADVNSSIREGSSREDSTDAFLGGNENGTCRFDDCKCHPPSSLGPLSLVKEERGGAGCKTMHCFPQEDNGSGKGRNRTKGEGAF